MPPGIYLGIIVVAKLLLCCRDKVRKIGNLQLKLEIANINIQLC